MSSLTRACPLCDGQAAGSAFPYAIRFIDQVFYYLRCRDCRTVFVDPVPDAACLALIYNKTSYHDSHYSFTDLSPYRKAALLCRQYAKPRSSVLDYGCGVGHFLQAIKAEGFQPHGVEFDASAAAAAAEIVGCSVLTVDDFDRDSYNQLFDVIHLGDVLEHLPDPAATISSLLKRLRIGGLLFVEGPLETNPSLVYWTAKLFGYVKQFHSPDSICSGEPSHLFLTSATAQSRFFRERFPCLKPVYWRVWESGWPYAQGNWIKRAIANQALAVGGKSVAGIVFGNRFQAIYILR